MRCPIRLAPLAVLLPLALAAPLAGADDKATLKAEGEKSFQRFAAAVDKQNWEEMAKSIAPPGDRVWLKYKAVRSASAKYNAALDAKFGEGPPLGWFSLGDPDGKEKNPLAAFLYETQGEIREVKEAGKDRVHVVVWTKRTVGRARPETALYERKFTAVKVGGDWKFHVHYPAGTPVVKKVKRTLPDGKEVEVYAEHDPTANATDQTQWKELPPISYDGPNADLNGFLDLDKIGDVLKAETEQVEKGAYPSREKAKQVLMAALEKVFRGK